MTLKTSRHSTEKGEEVSSGASSPEWVRIPVLDTVLDWIYGKEEMDCVRRGGPAGQDIEKSRKLNYPSKECEGF